MAEEQNLVFGLVIIFSGGAFLYHNLSRLKLPYTVIMFVYGMIMGFIGDLVPEEYANIFDGLASISPELVFHIFLPILIFEGSYGMKIHAFWSVFTIVLILASLGVVINTIFLSGFLMLLYSHWNGFLAALLGSLLSATDPVAVVALLKDLGVDKRVTAIVDGEAIMNDGTAIIMFTLFRPAAVTGAIDGAWYAVMLQCVQLTLGAFAFGKLMGLATELVLKLTRGNDLVQTSITVSFAYIAFFVGDMWLATSGVLTLCFMGTHLSSHLPSMFPGKEGSMLNNTWHFLVHLANTVLFAMVGMIIVRDAVPYIGFIHLVRIVLLYAACTVGRFLMIVMVMPLLHLNKNYYIGFKEAALLTHGGLRGGVATVLALIAIDTHGIPREDKMELLILTCGIVILTLVVNATSSAMVVAKLGHKSKDQNRLLQMEIGMHHVHAAAERSLRDTKLHPFFKATNWQKVSKLVRKMENPYKGVTVVQETDDRMFNVLLMRAFKTEIWNLRDADNIEENVVMALAEAANKNISRGTLITTNDLNEHMQYPALLSFMERKFMPHLTKKARQHDENPYLRPSQGAPSTATSTATSADEKDHLNGASPASGVDVLAEAQKGEPSAHDALSLLASAVHFWRMSKDQDFFGILVAYSEALDKVETLVKTYALSHSHVSLAERWLVNEKETITSKIDAYAQLRPRTLCALMTKIAAELVIKDIAHAAEELHETHGFALPATESLHHLSSHLRLHIQKWPPQIDLMTETQMLEQSDLFKAFGRGEFLAALQYIDRLTFAKGDSVEIGEAVGVVMVGVISAFGCADRELGPGDVFNVSPLLTQQLASNYIASSPCTILVIPFEKLQPFTSSNPLLLEAMYHLIAMEALSPMVRDYLLRFRKWQLGSVVSMLRSGVVVLASSDHFKPTFQVENNAGRQYLSRRITTAFTSGAAGTTNAATLSAEHVIAAARELLVAVVRGGEVLCYLNGETQDGCIQPHVGTFIVPMCMARKLFWKKGAALLIFTAKNDEDTAAHTADPDDENVASLMPRLGDDEDEEMVDVGHITRTADAVDTAAAAAPGNGLSSMEEGLRNREAISPSPSRQHYNSGIYTRQNLQSTSSSALMTAATLLTQYDPNNCLAPIPYVTKLQLQFLLELEQLMTAVAEFVRMPTSASRKMTSDTTEQTLFFLQRFCVESFSAEMSFYNQLAKHNKNKKKNSNDSANANATSVPAVVPTPIPVSPYSPIGAAMSDPRMRDHRSQHDSFIQCVSTWRERLAIDDMCHDDVILQMARFAILHFPKDKELCTEVVAAFPQMREVAHRSMMGGSTSGSFHAVPKLFDPFHAPTDDDSHHH